LRLVFDIAEPEDEFADRGIESGLSIRAQVSPAGGIDSRELEFRRRVAPEQTAESRSDSRPESGSDPRDKRADDRARRRPDGLFGVALDGFAQDDGEPADRVL